MCLYPNKKHTDQLRERMTHRSMWEKMWGKDPKPFYLTKTVQCDYNRKVITPYRYTKLNAGWFESNRESVEFTNLENLYGKITYGIHVWDFINPKYGPDIVYDEIVTDPTRYSYKIKCRVYPEHLVGANDMSAVFTKIWIPEEELKKAQEFYNG